LKYKFFFLYLSIYAGDSLLAGSDETKLPSFPMATGGCAFMGNGVYIAELL